MTRRELISRVSLIMGGTIVGSSFFLSGCKPSGNKHGELISDDQLAFLDEVADTIIPTTESPGAKAAQVGAFMAVWVKDCYEAPYQEIFVKGPGKMDDAATKKFGKGFLKLDAGQRTALLTEIDKEQSDYTKNKKAEEPPHYFRLIKEITLLGYFSSEAGCKQALRYLPVPGKYVGSIPYKKGDKAWAL